MLCGSAPEGNGSGAILHTEGLPGIESAYSANPCWPPLRSEADNCTYLWPGLSLGFVQGRGKFPVQILCPDLRIPLQLPPVLMAADQGHLLDGIAAFEKSRHALVPQVVKAKIHDP